MDFLSQIKPPKKYTLLLIIKIISYLTFYSCEAPQAPKGLFVQQHLETQNAGEEMIAGQGSSSSPEEEFAPEYQESFTGFWAHFSQVSTCVDIGSSLEQINRTLYIVKVEQEVHGALSETWEACEIDLTPVISVRAQVPEALRQSVYPLESRQGLLVGTPPQQVYHSGPVIELWGLNLQDELLDLMPNSPEDERIYDMDEDGEVGVTLQIGEACLAYMTQRRVTQYQGQFIAADHLQGSAASFTEQYIIDASAPICKTSYQTRSHPARSRFDRIRIDGQSGSLNFDLNQDGQIDCNELQMKRDQLFPSRFTVLEVDHSFCSL